MILLRSMAHNYRKGKSAEYSWTESFSFEHPMHRDEILEQLGELVVRFAIPDLPISGMLSGMDSERWTQAVLALDPSKKYGTPTLEQSQTIADSVVRELGWEHIDRHVPAARIIMGRLEGYGAGSRLHTMAEVAERADEISADTGVNLNLQEGDLFSLRSISKGLQRWTEPSVAVTAERPIKIETIDAMLELAHGLAQHRVVVELPGGTVGGQQHAATQVYEMLS